MAAAAGEFRGAMVSLEYFTLLSGSTEGEGEGDEEEGVAPTAVLDTDTSTGSDMFRGRVAFFCGCALCCEEAKLEDGNVFAFSFRATSLGFSALRRYDAKGEEPLMVGGCSAEGESRNRGVLVPESVPPRTKSPGVGVAQLSPPEKLSGGATMMSSSSSSALSLRDMLDDGRCCNYRGQSPTSHKSKHDQAKMVTLSAGETPPSPSSSSSSFPSPMANRPSG